MAGPRKGYISFTCYLPTQVRRMLDALAKQEAKRTGQRADRCRTAALIQAITLSYQKASTE